MAKAKYSFYRPHKRVTYTNELVNEATGEITNPPSMTKQEFAKECDINNILKQYSQPQMLAQVNAAATAGKFNDLPEGLDFQAALHLVKSAEETFLALPAKVRDRFGQDPQQFLEFFHNPENREEAEKLGLLEPKAEPPPPQHVIVDNPPTGGEGGTPPS